VIALATGPAWLQSLAGFGVGAIVIAILNGLFNKRKLSAEATKIITDAASGTVKDLREENQRIVAQNATQGAQIAAMQSEQATQREHQRQVEQVLAMHGMWDRQVVEIARQHDIELPAPPPLTTGS
jgi:hypothetical protein